MTELTEEIKEILILSDSYLSWMRHRANWPDDLIRDVDDLIIRIRKVT